MKKVLLAFLVLCSFCIIAVRSADRGTAQAAPAPAGEVDVDLTALSSTMIFGEVFNMTMNAEDYLGKTVKMKGAYETTYSETTGNRYHFVVIADAAACCQQGLEFAWTGKHKFPDDYPKSKTWIEVTGVYDSYEVEGYVHYYVKTDKITTPK